MSAGSGMRSTCPSSSDFRKTEEFGKFPTVGGLVGLGQGLALRAGLDPDHVARTDEVAGNVDQPAVDRNVAMGDHQTGLGSRQGQSQPGDDIVQAAFQQHHQGIARVALGPFGLMEVLAELPLQNAVVSLHLLLFAEVGGILRRLATTAGGHARRRFPPLEGTLGRIAAGAFEEQFHSLAAAEPANG